MFPGRKLRKVGAFPNFVEGKSIRTANQDGRQGSAPARARRGSNALFSDVGPHANTRVADARAIRARPGMCKQRSSGARCHCVESPSENAETAAIDVGRLVRDPDSSIASYVAMVYGFLKMPTTSATPTASPTNIGSGRRPRHKAPDRYSSCSSIFLLEEFDPSVSGF